MCSLRNASLGARVIVAFRNFRLLNPRVHVRGAYRAVHFIRDTPKLMNLLLTDRPQTDSRVLQAGKKSP